MIKQVAIAGGTGTVAQEVIDAILARGAYEVIILSRSDGPKSSVGRTQWRKVDYENKQSLVDALNGVETLLCFLSTGDANLQKALIQAAIEAKVRRFAPSEWASRPESGVAHYAYKDEIRKYLEEINREKKQIEYCLFQPGFFTNYFIAPHQTTKYLKAFKMFADFEHRRAIVLDSPDAPLTLTTVEDMSKLVAIALEYPSEWPTIGGIRGTQTTVFGLLALGERIRGPFNIERLPKEEVANGKMNVSWCPLIDHSAIPDEHREAVSRAALKEYVTTLAHGGWSVSDEWNKLLPDFEFMTAEEYLSKAWRSNSKGDLSS